MATKTCEAGICAQAGLILNISINVKFISTSYFLNICNNKVSFKYLYQLFLIFLNNKLNVFK